MASKLNPRPVLMKQWNSCDADSRLQLNGIDGVLLLVRVLMGAASGDKEGGARAPQHQQRILRSCTRDHQQRVLLSSHIALGIGPPAQSSL